MRTKREASKVNLAANAPDAQIFDCAAATKCVFVIASLANEGQANTDFVELADIVGAVADHVLEVTVIVGVDQTARTRDDARVRCQ